MDEAYFGEHFPSSIWAGVLWTALAEIGWELNTPAKYTMTMDNMGMIYANVMTDVAWSSLIYGN